MAFAAPQAPPRSPAPEAALLHAPTPTLPLGAGGPPRRAAGRVLATVCDPDPLQRLHAVAAAEAAGFAVEGPSAPQWPACRSHAVTPAVRFVSLDGPGACPRLSRAPRDACASPAPDGVVVGYGSASLPVLAAHARHGCATIVLSLVAAGGRPVFDYLPPAGFAGDASLTPREADVLILLLAGFTTAALAARLHMAPATARSHCRALLRKFAAPDRRALRARLLESPATPR